MGAPRSPDPEVESSKSDDDPLANGCRLSALLALAARPIGSRAITHQATPAAFQLPAPTGPYGVGTTSWHLIDSSRTETFVASPRPREVEVLAWYPSGTAAAASAGPPAPYLRESIAEARAFGTLIGAPGVFDDLASVATHAVLNAPAAAGSSLLPVLVFSHGYTGLASAYTALLEDLASHGYVVLSVVHPYEVAAATLSDGSVVTFLDGAGGLLKGVRDVMTEWKDEDAMMARQFCLHDTRCRAGLNLDGIPQSGTMPDGTMKRPFLMVYSARPGRLGASDAIYRHAAQTYYRVDVADTRHLDFSDMDFWGGPLRAAGAYGSIAPARAAELTRTIVLDYFDQELRGAKSPLLDGTRTLPEVRVAREP